MFNQLPSYLRSSGAAYPDLSCLQGPRFVITVDTEEEFDWSAPFSRDRHGTTHINDLPRFQSLCDDHGVLPCYLVDYPITQDRNASDLLGSYAADGRAEIGVQLHPWVNPPFIEDVSVINSYACNLPPALERQKLTILYNAIVESFGVRPDAYRAGRYGAGPETPSILANLGISIDSSVRSRFNYLSHGGPDYSKYPVKPYWLIENALIELPLTTVFSGNLRKAGDEIFSRWFGSDAARSLLARSNMLERIALTPEGIPMDKALQAIDLALDEGIPVITLSFHSPSVTPGHTPYVRNAADLEDFYAWWTAILRHLAEKNVRPTNMAEIKAATGMT